MGLGRQDRERRNWDDSEDGGNISTVTIIN